MEKLLEKINKLKQELDKTKEVQTIISLQEKIKKEKILLNKVELYHQTRKETLKEEIYSNQLYQEYKKAETELNILILEINSKLKVINNKGKCDI